MNEPKDNAFNGIPPEAIAVMQKNAAKQKRFRVSLTIALGCLVGLMFGGGIVLGLNFAFMGKWFGFIIQGIGYTLNNKTEPFSHKGKIKS